ncbi:MAG: cytochrome d ubiquinol oxidase subunit II [Bacteroidaceae bacterium]|nr:cytochrome d ubiquinol oxidase subunit II [Bacteroidaceae bacterium]
MITYSFLQQYWWFLISLLAGLLVFLLFVQGGQSLIYVLGPSEERRRLLIHSLGRKWELTFTTLVTFGGAFFAAFPLFYSTSFGGAYWLWMLLLLSFVVQAVSYEFQSKLGNVLGSRGYRMLLLLNGFFAPFLLGVTVATFFHGAAFTVSKDNFADLAQPVVSAWASPYHGLEALVNPWNLMLGFGVFFLVRVLGSLYFMNNIEDQVLESRCSVKLVGDFVLFLLFFLTFFVHLLLTEGFVVGNDGVVGTERYKYLHNFLALPWVAAVFLLGVVGMLYGSVHTILSKSYRKGIWPAGAGTVLTVLALMLTAGYHSTPYYPSTADAQSSLTIANSSSSFFTLKVMSIVSLLIPFVVAYIAYCWHAMDRESLTLNELKGERSSD